MERIESNRVRDESKERQRGWVKGIKKRLNFASTFWLVKKQKNMKIKYAL